MFKNKSKKENCKIIGDLIANIELLTDFSSKNIEICLKNFCIDNKIKHKELFMPIRLIITGKKSTPPLFETISVLGKEKCCYRLRSAFKALKKII